MLIVNTLEILKNIFSFVFPKFNYFYCIVFLFLLNQTMNDSPEIQKAEFLKHKDLQPSVGDPWYIIDLKWLDKWKAYVNFDDTNNGFTETTENPGPIDNSGLLDDVTKEFRMNCLLADEFDLIPEVTWNYLSNIYGTIHNSQVDKFRRIVHALPTGLCRVEIHPIILRMGVFKRPLSSKFVVKSFSRAATLGFVMDFIKGEFHIASQQETRLLLSKPNNQLEVIQLEADTQLEDSSLVSNDEVFLEEKNANSTWPFDSTARKSVTFTNVTTWEDNVVKIQPGGGSSSSSSQAAYHRDSPTTLSSVTSTRTRYIPGVCGLGNLGNTCFMNSALQCMSNVKPLTEYFLKDPKTWRSELNKENPLGMKGEIATVYQRLLQTMWSGTETSATPREFKISVSHFAPQFCGFSQHDSQELLVFLLDGLHEDLNRVKMKPYIETSDSNNRPDEEVAMESWGYHKKRNDSIIIDLFHGLLKSTVICPDCNRVSVTFDPFSSLSLPLPSCVEYSQIVHFVPGTIGPKGHPAPIIRLVLSLPKNGNIDDLKKSLGQMLAVPPNELKVAEVYDSKFYKNFGDSDHLRGIMARDIIMAYHLPRLSQPKTTSLKVTHMLKDKPFSTPFLVTVHNDKLTYNTLIEQIVCHLSRSYEFPGVQLEPNTGRIVSTSPTTQRTPMQVHNSNTNGRQQSGSSSEVEEEEEESVPTPAAAGQSQQMQTDNDDAGEEMGDALPLVDMSAYFDVMLVRSNFSFTLDPHNQRIYDLLEHRSAFINLNWKSDAKSKYQSVQSNGIYQDHPTYSSRTLGTRTNSINLSECLKLFTKPERLGTKDLWYCSHCKDHKAAEKKFDLWSLPEVLIIHLKRFNYDRYHRDKVDALVDFPVEDLDMSEWVVRKNSIVNLKYDLVSVSNHMGGLGGGHYTAYGRNFIDRQWYKFDDSYVSPVSEGDIVTRNAYVLVYRRKEATPSKLEKKEEKEMMEIE